MKDTMREEIIRYIADKYKTEPEYPMAKSPDRAVFRHEDTRKQFAAVRNIPCEKSGKYEAGTFCVLDIRLSDLLLRDILFEQEGFFACNTSRGNWISAALDGTVPYDTLTSLIDTSFAATASGKKKQEMRPPKEWLIPSNPKYYDIISAFNASDIIDWKQGAGVKKDDTVFMYVGSPVSAILYKCRVIEMDIPYDFRTEGLTIKKLMKIKLLKRYSPDEFTFERLKSEFGIFAVRGPRGVPNSLSTALK